MPPDEQHYQTVSLIAADADACVYLAQSQAPGYVALKLLTRCRAADDVLERFERWKPALLSLKDANLAPIVDAGLSPGGSVYVVSRYVPGSPLAAVAARQNLTPQQRAAFRRQLASAVDAMHAAGLVHLKLDATKVKVVPGGDAGGPLTILGVGSALVVEGRRGPPQVDLAAVTRLAVSMGL